MSRPIIAVDIDDTISQSLEAFRVRANTFLGADLQPEDYTIAGEYWNYYEKVWDQHGLAGKVTVEEVYEDLHTDQSVIPLLPGAEFALDELMKRFEVVLLTARDSRWEEATRAWLVEQFGQEAPEVYFSRGHLDSSSKNKGQICKDMGAKWLIDDNVQHCITARDEGVTAILYGDYGWQTSVPADLVACKSWQEVLEYFDGQR